MREMKDSGIEWIGEIANTHKLVRLKYVAEILNEYRKPVTAQYRNQNADILYDYYGASGIIDKIDGYTIDDHVMLIGEDGANLKLRNLPLMYEVCGKAWINNHAHILKPMKNVDFYYLFYALEALDINNYITGSAQPKLNQENLKEILIPLPSYGVQKKVSSYLDTQCSEIDATAEDIQKEISLLEDYKKSVITEAVTKGLNPDAEMKDSGIEWIGEIPKEWTVKNLKYIFDITSGSTPASGVSQYWDGDIKWITPADFKTNDVYVFGGRRNITGLGLMSCSTQVIPDSSIIFSKRAPIGSVVITGEKMCINQGCLALISKHQKTSVKFYYYALSILDKIFDMLGNGTTFKEISAFRFSNTSLQCPRFEEQQQIADYLDTKCSEIDTLIADKKRQLDILADYKKSLIYEYVTGKKEVPVNE